MSEKPFSAIKKKENGDLEGAGGKQSQTDKIKSMAHKLSKPAESMEFLEMYHKSAVKVDKARGKLKVASIGLGLISAAVFIRSIFSFYEAYNQQTSKPRLSSGMATDFSNISETESFVEDLV